MGLYLGGLIIRGIFVSKMWGAYFLGGFRGEGGGGYLWNFMVVQCGAVQCSVV